MEEKASNYLTRLADGLRSGGDAAAAAVVDEALVEYKRRHWHEMSVCLLKAVTAPGVLAEAYDLHDNVITVVRADISPVAYVKLIQAVCFSPTSTMEKALAVIEGAQACFVGQEATQGRFAAQCVRAMLLLQVPGASGSGNEEAAAAAASSVNAPGGVWCEARNRELTALASVPGTGPHTARKILEEVETYIQSLQMHEVEPVLLAMLCRARGRDYELRGQHTRYYANAFDVVTYSEKAEMVVSDTEMDELAFTTAVAALLSEEIFNFGKFLNFRQFASSLKTDAHKHAWILEWMVMCNEGDVKGFEAFFAKNQDTIQKQAQVLNEHKAALGNKVRLMGLLHLVFYTPFNERTFDFSTIAERCSVRESEAEPLLLAALAQGIVKGKIDGLLKQVHISWVEPRVLSLLEVKELAVHVTKWRETVVGLSSYVAEQAKQITK